MPIYQPMKKRNDTAVCNAVLWSETKGKGVKE